MEAPFAPGTGERVQRVVSLTPSLTETVCDLGASSQLIAVTDNDHYPPEVEHIPSVGNMYTNLEVLTSSHPDVVLADLNVITEDTVSRLKQLKLNILCLDTESIDDLRRNIPILGKALKVPQNADALLKTLDKEQAEINSAAKSFSHPYRIFLELSSSPLITCGSGGLVNSFIVMAGAQNIYSDQKSHYPTVSNEDLLKRNPEIILLTTTKVKDAVRLPGWQKLDAVKKGHIYFINPDLLCRPTRRSLQGVKEIQSIIKKLEADQYTNRKQSNKRTGSRAMTINEPGINR